MTRLLKKVAEVGKNMTRIVKVPQTTSPFFKWQNPEIPQQQMTIQLEKDIAISKSDSTCDHVSNNIEKHQQNSTHEEEQTSPGMTSVWMTPKS